jgi:hypothetical protein
MNKQSEFYVGYLPMPAKLKTAIRRIVYGLGVLIAAVGIVLVFEQTPFAASTFEYGQYRGFEGLFEPRPYPSLIASDGAAWLLVAPGKHGFAGETAEGSVIRLRGERIYRGEDRMVEVEPGSFEVAGRGAGFETGGSAPQKVAQLTGEIVDSKCYFGVMNPGNGKVHRDCAARCIAGGIPPAFLVRDASGRAETLLLADWKRALLDHVAEPVTLRGRIGRSAGRLVFHVE